MEDIIYQIVTLVLSATGACAWIAAKLEKAPDNKWLALAYKIINYVGGNVFHATNKVD